MDPQFGLASKDDLWRLQNEMKNVYATQAEHADRLMRLEQRSDSDTRLKSVWDHGYNPAAEAFKNFDQDQPGSMLGSLHLDTEDEPRRGAASRANSVRFDESALHGHFGQGSRSSADFLPMRTGSAFGSHPMTERSSSHKSDGRQSSTHSARASSFGLETRPLSAAVAPFVPLGPPPGLFILGPVPSIIRCWLDTNFSNESLLYASVCTGSYKSILDVDLINRLGYQDQITIDREGQKTIKLPVYLPEATIQQSSSRSSSPAPSLPTLTTSFVIHNLQCKTEAIQIFLGCDVLRTRNADVHFSLDRLTLFDDDRNKLSVPLVRPENATLFQNLQTTIASDTSLESSLAKVSGPASEIFKTNGKAKEAHIEQSFRKPEDKQEETKTPTSANAMPPPAAPSPSVIGEGRKMIVESGNSESISSVVANTDLKGSDSLTNGTTPDTPTRSESSNVWGSWRRDSTQGTRADSSAAGSSNTGYQRAGRGRGMKVLRPARLNTSRASSAQQQPVGFDAAPSRFGDSSKPENDESQSPATDQRSFSGDTRGPLQALTNKPRSTNPIGGASAFGWLNSSQQKQGPSE
ncbi:MAG: hypothetical protein ASARMPRED_007990 [Alectoria sarmentosa]|nr:MAG: hypothetical protein ASARMPRED_007990 [Alectoria sarmentosa]